MSNQINQLAGSLKVVNEQKKILANLKQLNTKYDNLEKKNNELNKMYNELQKQYKEQEIIINNLTDNIAKQGTLLLQYIEKDIKPVHMTEQEYLYNKVSNLQLNILNKDIKKVNEEKDIKIEEFYDNIQKDKFMEEQTQQTNQTNQTNQTQNTEKKTKENINITEPLLTIHNFNRRLSIL